MYTSFFTKKYCIPWKIIFQGYLNSLHSLIKSISNLGWDDYVKVIPILIRGKSVILPRAWRDHGAKISENSLLLVGDFYSMLLMKYTWNTLHTSNPFKLSIHTAHCIANRLICTLILPSFLECSMKQANPPGNDMEKCF